MLDMTCVGADVNQHDYDTLLSEYHIQRQKLNSKTEALLILSKELEDCRNNRDKWKSVVEDLKIGTAGGGGRFSNNKQHIDNKILSQNLCECKEKIRILQIENKDLKQKLQDATGDVKVLREQITRNHNLGSVGSCTDDEMSGGTCNGTIRHFSAHERNRLVEHLESIKMKYALLERDLQAILDEKEELIVERDAYRHKVDRLNHQLNFVLKGDDKKIIDIDSILMENRYLQERLKQTQEEKSLYLQTLSKYKNILEKRRNKSSLKLGSNGGSNSVIITHKQVAKMLQDTSLSHLPATQATIADLRSLALALFESLNDKNVALAHQKKTNKILGHRLADLEHKLAKLEFPPECIIPGDTDAENVSKDDLAKSLDDDRIKDEQRYKDVNEQMKQSEVATDRSLRRVLQRSDSDLKPIDEHRSETSTPDPQDWQLASPKFRSRQSSYSSDCAHCGSPKSVTIKSPNTQSPVRRLSTTVTVDDDLSPELKKLVQDAMEDLDRRLSQTSND